VAPESSDELLTRLSREGARAGDDLLARMLGAWRDWIVGEEGWNGARKGEGRPGQEGPTQEEEPLTP